MLCVGVIGVKWAFKIVVVRPIAVTVIDGEKGVGPSLAQKYGITAYPSLIVTNAEGKPVLYTMGYIDAETLLKFADAALKKK